MKEFCKKEIDFQVIKLNNSVNKMIEGMKQFHQEVEVTDMSGAREELRAMRMEAMEADGEADAMGGGGGGAKFAAPTHEEVELFMEEKLKCAAIKGIKGKVKGKMMKKC